MKNNTVINKAKNKYRRDYITPEDINEVIDDGVSLNKVAKDVLEVLSNTSGFGAEDKGLCAFVIFNKLEEQS